MNKICSKCKKEKIIMDFKPDPRLKSGFSSKCKDCFKEYLAEYYSNNKTKSHNTNQKNYYANRDAYLEVKRRYRRNNKEYLREKDAQYYLANKDLIIKRANQWNKKKLTESPQYRFKKNLRKRLWDAFQYQSLKKAKKTFDLVGCTYGELIDHIEKQFTYGMTWKNYGKWHLDHIQPCISFDLTNPQEQQKCFHYSNLQPLWARDNLIKNDNLNWQKPDDSIVQ